MTAQPQGTARIPADVAAEVAQEQRHVDTVYSELTKAGERVKLVEAEGLARGRTDRTGDVRLEESAGLFERDALMFSAGQRRASLEQQYEGLVFGRLDMDHAPEGADPDREIRYIGRIGVRDDDYESLVIDWRAPAASPFYRSTPVEPMDVVRRRVLRCRGPVVIGVEDDLMVPEAPDDMVVVGDGALMAALTRSRGERMRDIVATIQRHQDEAIRAGARGVTEITGGPGTGKTVVALHRAAYLLYSDRRRFESGGILVIGPSAAYTAYIERVLPSLGEDSVALRSLGDVVDGMATAVRLDSPAAARVKGSLRIREVLGRAAREVSPDAPTQLRTMVAGHPVRLDAPELRQVRRRVLRHHQHNHPAALAAVQQALGEASWAQVRPHSSLERTEFLDRFDDHLEVESFVKEWWRPIDPREVLLWLTDPERLRQATREVLSEDDARLLGESLETALSTGTWSVADIALVDDLSARLGVVQDQPKEERGFYDIEELDSLSDYGVTEVEVTGSRTQGNEVQYERMPLEARDRLLQGRVQPWAEYAHVLVDEAQDLSPMQWRMVGRRGRYASWTVVGDAAQASWPVPQEAVAARDEAFGTKPRQTFHMDTNYRNAREIFDYAATVVRREVPDADIPQAVREVGVDPRVVTVAPVDVLAETRDAVQRLLTEVDGAIAVVAPERHHSALAEVGGLGDGRVLLIDPMSTKGLEYDGTVVVDPAAITAESPGGIRVLYVALTRAAHRMTVLEVRS